MSPPDSPLCSPVIDTHAHLDDKRLRADLDLVLERAKCASVGQIIVIGTTATTSAAAVEIAEAHPGLFAAVGIHPNDASEAEEADWTYIAGLANHAAVVAIGETGLDRYWKRTPFEVQQQWFERHLGLAAELNLPVVIHSRDSQSDIIEQLTRWKRPLRGVMHAFTGTWDDAQACLELGLYLSFAGPVTFTNKNLEPLRDVASRVPSDRILVETDSPYLSPHPFRGQINEPARVVLTAARLAELRGLSLDEFAQITTNNARRLFRLPDDRVL